MRGSDHAGVSESHQLEASCPIVSPTNLPPAPTCCSSQSLAQHLRQEGSLIPSFPPHGRLSQRPASAVIMRAALPAGVPGSRCQRAYTCKHFILGKRLREELGVGGVWQQVRQG